MYIRGLCQLFCVLVQSLDELREPGCATDGVFASGQQPGVKREPVDASGAQQVQRALHYLRWYVPNPDRGQRQERCRLTPSEPL